jgi:hypothetical protein
MRVVETDIQSSYYYFFLLYSVSSTHTPPLHPSPLPKSPSSAAPDTHTSARPRQVNGLELVQCNVLQFNQPTLPRGLSCAVQCSAIPTRAVPALTYADLC